MVSRRWPGEEVTTLSLRILLWQAFSQNKEQEQNLEDELLFLVIKINIQSKVSYPSLELSNCKGIVQYV